MPSSREPLVIGPFAGGLNTYDDPTAVRDTELVEALKRNEEALEARVAQRTTELQQANEG